MPSELGISGREAPNFCESVPHSVDAVVIPAGQGRGRSRCLRDVADGLTASARPSEQRAKMIGVVAVVGQQFEDRSGEACQRGRHGDVTDVAGVQHAEPASIVDHAARIDRPTTAQATYGLPETVPI